MRQRTVSRNLKDDFARLIRSGQWPVGQPIPTEMALTQRLGASRTSVRRALKELEAQGWLSSIQGSGRRVTQQSQQWSATIGLLARGGELAVGQGGRFLRSFDMQTAQRGHALLLYAGGVDPDESVITLPQRGLDVAALDAAIFYSPQYRLSDVQQLAQRIPVVSTPHDASTIGVPSFVVDYGLHASLAVEALARLGHRHIALIQSSDPQRAAVSAGIRRGFELGRLHAGLPRREEVVIAYGRPSTAQQYRQAYEACRQLDPPVTAVISRVVTPLEQCVAMAQAAGDRWAQSASFVCLSDLTGDRPEIARFAHFAYDLETMVADVVEHLDQRLRGQQPTRLQHTYFGVLQPGETLLPAP